MVLLPPHAETPPANTARSMSAPSGARSLRRCGAMPNSSMQANAAPPPAYHGMPRPGSLLATQDVVELAVVVMVIAPVPEATEVMVTGLVEPKLRVGGLMAPEGLAVIAAVNVTTALPMKLLDGVTVTVDTLPAVAPAVTVTAVPETV